MPYFAVSIVAYAIALFGFRIFDPIPLAHRAVITQMREGVLVLDAHGRIASLNPAAERILLANRDNTVSRFIDQPVKDFLPAYLNGHFADHGYGEIEFSLGKGQASRSYTLAVSLLKDWRGLEVGRLLLLHDVTAQKQAQAQIVEQQRTLATLQERERLAHELHDSTSQVLSYISLQANAIRKQIKNEDLPEVDAQINRLAEVAQAALLEVRESILSLNAGAGQTWSFRAALRQYLDVYQDQYGIQTVLILPDEYQEGRLSSQTEVQLMRVIQEAMTNAHKHGSAQNVEVSFAVQRDEGISILIADDGCGFDAGLASRGRLDHYGLQFMRERMQQIGGCLQINSVPGRGARVMLQIPDPDQSLMDDRN